MKQMIYKGPGDPPERMIIPVWDPNKLAMVNVPVVWSKLNGKWVTGPLPESGVFQIVKSSQRTAQKVVDNTEFKGNLKQKSEEKKKILADAQYYDIYEPEPEK